MLKNLSLTQEEEMLKQKFSQLQKFRQDTTKPDQRDLKMKLTLKGSSKASSGRVGSHNSIANAKAILNQEREQKELKKESGFKRPARVNPIVSNNNNAQYNDNNSPEKKRNFEFDNNDDPRQPSMDYQENAKRAKTENYNDYNNNNNNNNNDDNDNVVCITDLPESCTEESLRERFEVFGPIKVFQPQFQECSEKYALIHYYSSSVADDVVAAFEKEPMFEGKVIQVYKPNLDDNEY
jgi:hypothetical protein